MTSMAQAVPLFDLDGPRGTFKCGVKNKRGMHDYVTVHVLVRPPGGGGPVIAPQQLHAPATRRGGLRLHRIPRTLINPTPYRGLVRRSAQFSGVNKPRD